MIWLARPFQKQGRGSRGLCLLHPHSHWAPQLSVALTRQRLFSLSSLSLLCHPQEGSWTSPSLMPPEFSKASDRMSSPHTVQPSKTRTPNWERGVWGRALTAGRTWASEVAYSRRHLENGAMELGAGESTLSSHHPELCLWSPPIPKSPRGGEVCKISQSCFCTVLCIEGKDASGTSDLKGPSVPRSISILKSLPRDREATDADHS